ncbi:MAG: hypothetical protein LBV32_11350 [Tannerellaceae bacterium]|jgi:hypothetical protein|nr:hypothetical protein [Tannerellaceae bacterium]
MKESIRLCLLFSVVLLFCGCEKTKEEKDIKLETLRGTKWKLEGIVDETGALKVLEPKDCEECFTLTFFTDYMATVRSIDHNTFTFGLQNLNPDIGMNYDLWLELYDKDGKYYINGDDFRRSIITTKSYAATHNELTLYSKYYTLLFKLQQP